MRFISMMMLVVLLSAPLAFAQEADFDRAMAAYVKGDYGTAAEYLKEYVSANPEAKAYYVLGYASYALERNEEAAGYFRQAYLIEPDFDPTEAGFVYKERTP